MHWADTRAQVRDEIRQALKEYRATGNIETHIETEDKTVLEWEKID